MSLEAPVVWLVVPLQVTLQLPPRRGCRSARAEEGALRYLLQFLLPRQEQRTSAGARPHYSASQIRRD